MARKRILVVDDDVDTADVFRLLLESAGYDVAVAYDGATALSIAMSHPPDAAVLNITMPGMDGFEVCRQLRAMPWGEKVVIVAVSGWSRAQVRQGAVAAGFDGYLVKPVRFDDLLASIQHR